MKYAVDLDETLCTLEHWTKHSIAEPIVENIEKINQLFEEGHLIYIYTGRYKEDYNMTKEWLVANGVKHHYLVMGKLIVDCYIDVVSKRPEEL